MKNVKKNRKLYITLLLLMFLIGAALIFAGYTYIKSGSNVSFGDAMRADQLTMLIMFLVMIPILLLALTVAVLIFGRRSARKANQMLFYTSAERDLEPKERIRAGRREGGSGERFCMLSEIDRNSEQYKRAFYEKNVTMESFCNDFRNYAANKLKLYYDIEDIRRFVAGLAVSKLVILQGMSGTGKTSLAHAFGSFTDNSSTVIPVQPMWKERTDLIGYYNEFTKRFNETLLLEKMYEANYSEDMYITVLDEMNIARVEYYFAEFLSLLELPNPDERYLDVVSDKWETDPKQFVGGRIKLPENMWFIGTANNDDSTFAISDKVYDRAMILNLDTKCERFSAPFTSKKPISAEQFKTLAENAVKEYSVSQRNAKRLEEFDKYLIKHFHITFGNRIMKQIRTYIPVYVACGGAELTALDDILAKKVIRKLETQNPIYLRNSAEELLSFIDDLFGADKMPLCKEYIHRLQRNA